MMSVNQVENLDIAYSGTTKSLTVEGLLRQKLLELDEQYGGGLFRRVRAHFSVINSKRKPGPDQYELQIHARSRSLGHIEVRKITGDGVHTIHAAVDALRRLILKRKSRKQHQYKQERRRLPWAR
jgi:ribosome-associated translation inhibitor RaiA